GPRGGGGPVRAHPHPPGRTTWHRPFVQPRLLRAVLHRPRHLRRPDFGQRPGPPRRAQGGAQAVSLNEIRCLPSCASTNLYAKEHIEEFGPVGAVYTTCQTEGRGRLGRRWVNAAGQALYYTAVLKVPMVQPETLPLFASL